jgi:hypothetical protein
MSFVLSNMNIIDLLQEAFNFLATFDYKINHPGHSFATFSLENYFKLFPEDLKDIHHGYNAIKQLLEKQT